MDMRLNELAQLREQEQMRSALQRAALREALRDRCLRRARGVRALADGLLDLVRPLPALPDRPALMRPGARRD